MRAPGEAPGPQYPPDAFVRIGTDDSVTILINKAEMGQGVYTSLAMLVAEELECDWSKVRAEAAPVAPVYGHTIFGLQMTGGSSSVWSSWEQLRSVGAMLRTMLIEAGAKRWGVPPAECRAENGFVIHEKTKSRLSYGALAKAAEALPPPATVTLKQDKDLRILGRPRKRLDTPAKVTGKAIFGIDAHVPGMLVAVIARPPVFGGTLVRFDDAKAKQVAGVRHIVQVPSGVAVVATGFWAAKRGRDALEVVWDDGANGRISSATIREQYEGLSRSPGTVARREGEDTAQAIQSAEKHLEANYEVPYLAHAPMEPLNCLVDLKPDTCEIWTGTQFQSVDREAAARIAGLKPEQVQIHTTFLGGGFGRRANPHSDFVSEAVHVAKAVGSPVKVVWTREDDIQGGYYRPYAFDRLAAGLDAAGNPVAWHHTLVAQSFILGTPFESALVKDGVDGTLVEGAADLPYAIPRIRVEMHCPPSGVPTLWWRSVGHSHTCFVVESFLDELAKLGGHDPYAFRRGLLANSPRHLGVLELATTKAGWGGPLPPGRARGLAVHDSFGSYVAQVAEVSLQGGAPKVERVVCAIDCGKIVNPDTIAAQLEGAVVFGLSAALYGQITLKDGRVEQSNFHDYPLVRMAEMPAVEVHIVPSQEKPGGVGEPGVPPIAPAVANALCALTGKRVRRLPISPGDLRL
jgi:isoquinoline 1-oxidoreductase beta subunit